MKFIMFTKHLEGLDVPEIAKALKSVGVEGADLCVRPGYPVDPSNAPKELPAASRLFADEGLSIPLITTPGDFVTPDMDYAEDLYGACAEAGVKHVKCSGADGSTCDARKPRRTSSSAPAPELSPRRAASAAT